MCRVFCVPNNITHLRHTLLFYDAWEIATDILFCDAGRIDESFRAQLSISFFLA